MSWEAVKHVMDSSKAVGTDRLVLLALAEAADKLTWDTWIGHDTIGRKAGGVKANGEPGVHERTVQRSLRKLAEMGELKVIQHGAPQPDRKFQYRSNLYRIVRSLPAAVSSSGDTPATTTSGLVVTSGASSGDKSRHLVVTPLPPKPEVEPSIEPTTTESLSVVDEIEAGIRLAVKRIADDQERGQGFRKNRRAFEIGTEKTIRTDRAEDIAKARHEGWSAKRLADELAPLPYVESVAKGADRTPEVTWCGEHHAYLTECPSDSGHRLVRDWKHDEVTYNGQTFQGYRFWSKECDEDNGLYVDRDGSVRKACACNGPGKGIVDCSDCGNTGSILIREARSVPWGYDGGFGT